MRVVAILGAQKEGRPKEKMTDWLAHDLGESASGVEMGRMP